MAAGPTGDARAFHEDLPGYGVTPLVELADVAADLSVGRVFVKDESSRLDLPAFKILGASWGSARVMAARTGASLNLVALRAVAADSGLRLVTATDGNHGRAVAHMASLLGVAATVFVPAVMTEESAGLIRAEGAEVVRTDGDYDDAVGRAAAFADDDDACELVQDTAWEGYEQVPEWIVEGYETLLDEVDQVLGGAPDLVAVPVGVGSLAQAVVTHYRRRESRHPSVLAVEPVSAACVLASLLSGSRTSIKTGATNMAGLNCGTPSVAAWPVLLAGCDAAVAVTDDAATLAVTDLPRHGVSSGPSGAATLAGVRGPNGTRERNTASRTRHRRHLDCCPAEYRRTTAREHRRSQLTSDVLDLLDALVSMDSSNPGLSEEAPGESAIGAYVADWARAAGLRVEVLEKTPGRPNVLVRGGRASGGRTLLLCGHLDTVGLSGMDQPLVPRVASDRLYARGAYDMKAGLAAALVACRDLAASDISGEILVAAVADEEHASMGIQEVLAHLGSGTPIDAAIVTEPTELQIGTGHRGFVWTEVEVTGVAAHGSRPHLGVDAILNAGPVLVAFGDLNRQLSQRPHPFLGPGNLHGSLIEGGTEESTIPDRCVFIVERRTLPGETVGTVEADVHVLLEKCRAADPTLDVVARTTLAREPLETPQTADIVTTLQTATRLVTGQSAAIAPMSYWADSAFIAAAGIPTVLYGPDGDGAHADIEWVSLAGTERCTQVLTAAAVEFCC